MLTENFVAAIRGPPLASNTAIARDVGIYSYRLQPSFEVKTGFKKSSAPPHGIAVSPTHIFAAQQDKAHVYVYSRAKGNQEALIPFSERITALCLVEDVLVLGTAEGRIMVWETCTGKLITTPACHVQAVTCLAATPYHILSGSADSNVHVWSLARLLDPSVQNEHEPLRTLSNHRGVITDLVVGSSHNPETSICITSSEDRTCVLWNYQTGDPLRTILLPTIPRCLGLDATARTIVIATDDRSIYSMNMFGSKPLIGLGSEELASTTVQPTAPLAVTDSDAGPAQCLAINYDGSIILTGHANGRIYQWSLTANAHPTELADVNASVTNLVFPPILPHPATKAQQVRTVVKPTKSAGGANSSRQTSTFTSHFTDYVHPSSTLSHGSLSVALSSDPLLSQPFSYASNRIGTSRFEQIYSAAGVPRDYVESVVLSIQEQAMERECNELPLEASLPEEEATNAQKSATPNESEEEQRARQQAALDELLA